MTTITNFVEGNFIVNPQSKEVERPLWIVNTRRAQFRPELIAESMIAKCIQDSKPLIHVDLGLRNISKYARSQTTLLLENNLPLAKLNATRPYYLIKTTVQDKKKPAFLPKLLSQINQAVQSSPKLKTDKSESGSSTAEYGLLIEGFEAFHLLTKEQSHCSSDLEVFIASLTNLSAKFRQVVVITYPSLLPEELNFALQRISTCLTRLDSFNGEEWTCTSTVRRYTGFTNEQQYTIKKGDGRLKVIKHKAAKKQGKSAEQNEMINSLGFKAQKTEQHKQQEAALKQMIFPHLQMRQVCKPGCQTANCCKKEGPPPTDLIVLDDEQEDDDDVDV